MVSCKDDIMSFQEKKNICSPDACKLTHWFTSFQMDSKLQSYSQTGKTMNTRNISEMLLWCKKKANWAWEN